MPKARPVSCRAPGNAKLCHVRFLTSNIEQKVPQVMKPPQKSNCQDAIPADQPGFPNCRAASVILAENANPRFKLALVIPDKTAVAIPRTRLSFLEGAPTLSGPVLPRARPFRMPA